MWLTFSMWQLTMCIKRALWTEFTQMSAHPIPSHPFFLKGQRPIRFCWWASRHLLSHKNSTTTLGVFGSAPPTKFIACQRDTPTLFLLDGNGSPEDWYGMKQTILPVAGSISYKRNFHHELKLGLELERSVTQLPKPPLYPPCVVPWWPVVRCVVIRGWDRGSLLVRGKAEAVLYER